LIRVVEMLENEENLPDKYRNHKLKGEFKNRWELHIEPDWLLVYKRGNGEIILERTGSHSDLFE
jgi:mRNA interferase YafQ